MLDRCEFLSTFARGAAGSIRVADTSDVQSRITTLRELVNGSMYAIDERAVADALMMRARVKETVPEQGFRSEQRWMPIRSFRRERGARSFRLCSRAPTVLSRR